MNQEEELFRIIPYNDYAGMSSPVLNRVSKESKILPFKGQTLAVQTLLFLSECVHQK